MINYAALAPKPHPTLSAACLGQQKASLTARTGEMTIWGVAQVDQVPPMNTPLLLWTITHALCLSVCLSVCPSVGALLSVVAADIQILMGSLVYLRHGIENSPYRTLLETNQWAEICNIFTRDACALLGLSVESPYMDSVDTDNEKVKSSQVKSSHLYL